MVAFYYPPTRGSSGIQRTLRFAKYLPEFGWEPIVLTAHRLAYTKTDDEVREPVPGVRVCRPFALDTKRHLAVGNRYPASSPVRIDGNRGGLARSLPD